VDVENWLHCDSRYFSKCIAENQEYRRLTRFEEHGNHKSRVTADAQAVSQIFKAVDNAHNVCIF
jgi:hypothetical protein